jgi:hypothetical protein
MDGGGMEQNGRMKSLTKEKGGGFVTWVLSHLRDYYYYGVVLLEVGEPYDDSGFCVLFLILYASLFDGRMLDVSNRCLTTLLMLKAISLFKARLTGKLWCVEV